MARLIRCPLFRVVERDNLLGKTPNLVSAPQEASTRCGVGRLSPSSASFCLTWGCYLTSEPLFSSLYKGKKETEGSEGSDKKL